MSEHGTFNRYTNDGCRCDECKLASREYFRDRRKRGLPKDDPRHGTHAAYSHYGCKCPLCVEGIRTRALEATKGVKNHGTNAGYVSGCRCEPCRDYKRNARFKGKYGITLAEYNEILEGQGGGCASCGDTPDPELPRFSLDHHHESGRVRGVLCNACNAALGFLKEDRNRMLALIDYIDKWS